MRRGPVTDRNGDPICVGEQWCQFLNAPEAREWFEALLALVFGGGLGVVMWFGAVWLLRRGGDACAL